MKARTFILLLVGILIFPTLSFAYTSVISEPKNQSVIIPILEAEKPQEFFGVLDGYPHTYTFFVEESLPFKASLFAFDLEKQQNDVSIIIVKSEKRGVSEVGRTKIKEESWKKTFDATLVASFRDGGALESELVPGMYTLEVSSPNNDGMYRLNLGQKTPSYGYVDNLRRLFEVQALLPGKSFAVLLSPLIYVPGVILLLLCIFAGYILARKYNLFQKTNIG